MFTYLQPIAIAAVIFLVIAAMISVPWLFVMYRKHGFFSFSMTLVVFSFIYYFLAAFLLTMLPLPESRNNCIAPGARSYSLVPFQFIRDLLRETNVVWSQPSTYIYLFKERAFFQAFFNFLLLMPMGVYLRYFMPQRRRWLKALVIVFLMTLTYEVTQVTGIFGLYDCPYRLFDVDDLMLNTLGGIIGFFIAPIILSLFPSRANIEQKAAELIERDEVRNMVVFLAIIVDIAIVEFFASIVTVIAGSFDIWSVFIIHTLILFIYFVTLPGRWHGQTVGTKLLRFRYDHPQLIRKLTKRMLAIFLVYALQFTAAILSSIEVDMESTMYIPSIILSIVSIVLSAIITIVLFVHVITVLFSRESRKFFFDQYAKINTTRKAKIEASTLVHDQASEHAEGTVNNKPMNEQANESGQNESDQNESGQNELDQNELGQKDEHDDRAEQKLDHDSSNDK